jgi:hypothetical protein
MTKEAKNPYFTGNPANSPSINQRFYAPFKSIKYAKQDQLH